MQKRVVIAGASGLVGSLVAFRLYNVPGLQLVTLVRRPAEATDRAVDYESMVDHPRESLAPLIDGHADLAICCLGTTIAKAGSQAVMRRIDHDYALAFAKAARACGVRHFILVSSVGAGGSGFYLSLKGELESAIRAVGFERLDIIRPGLLIGPRNERRAFEALAQRVQPVLDGLLVGGLSKYRSLPAATVADAIAALARQPNASSGTVIHHYESLTHWAASL